MTASLAERVELWSAREAAERIGLRPSTLANRRSRGLGPPFVKVGRRVMYRILDVADWLDQQTRPSSASGSPHGGSGPETEARREQ